MSDLLPKTDIRGVAGCPWGNLDSRKFDPDTLMNATSALEVHLERSGPLALHLARENVFAVAPQVNRDPGQESQARFEAEGKLNFAEYFLCFSISPNCSCHSTIQPSNLTLV